MTAETKGAPLRTGRLPAARLVAAGLVAAVIAVLAVLIVGNHSNLVTRGPNSPPAALDAAWEVVNNPDSTPDQLARAEDAARTALRKEPLSSSPVSLVAAIRDRQGQTDKAENLMRVAAKLNGRANIAQLWLFNHLLAQQKYDEAFTYADALLRRETDFTEQLFPELAGTLNDPAAVAPLARRLAKNPAWRPVFTEAVIENYPDPTGAFTLLSDIRASGGVVSQTELTAYLTRLVVAHRYEEAYLNWVLFLPEDVSSHLANVYDGEFDDLPAVRPFGWDIGGSISGDIESPPGSLQEQDPALHVRYDGLAGRKFPQQLLVLPPGRYVLKGQVMTTTAASAGRLAWTVQCVGTANDLVRAPAPDTDNAWQGFEAAFTISKDCPAQRLALSAGASESRADVDAWYDAISVEPAGSAG